MPQWSLNLKFNYNPNLENPFNHALIKVQTKIQYEKNHSVTIHTHRL